MRISRNHILRLQTEGYQARVVVRAVLPGVVMFQPLPADRELFELLAFELLAFDLLTLSPSSLETYDEPPLEEGDTWRPVREVRATGLSLALTPDRVSRIDFARYQGPLSVRHTGFQESADDTVEQEGVDFYYLTDRDSIEIEAIRGPSADDPEPPCMDRISTCDVCNALISNGDPCWNCEDELWM